MKHIIAVSIAVSAATLFADLVPVSPRDGETVALVPDAQKKVMNLPTYAERLELLQADRKSDKKLRHSKQWQVARPLVLKWKATADEKGPWKILIGKKPDLSDAREWYVSARKTDGASGRATGEEAASSDIVYEVPRANLEVATTYYWRVCTRGRCGEWNCSPWCKCKECKRAVVSEIASFATEDFAPRWIAIEGHVGNIRDLGGRRTLDGRRVRQGLIYRGQGLNSNSITGERRGRNRLTVEDVEYFTGTLGVKTDLDLRSKGETADLAVSPLGPPVKLVLRSSACYRGIFDEGGMATMAENFRLFCDEKNYPIYFHCIAGADRTGSLAYVLNGVLGVDRHELETDWESTFYPTLAEMESGYTGPDFWKREQHFNDGFGKYGDANTPWNERIVLYLKACGVTDAEIAAFRRIMLGD